MAQWWDVHDVFAVVGGKVEFHRNRGEKESILQSDCGRLSEIVKRTHICKAWVWSLDRTSLRGAERV